MTNEIHMTSKEVDEALIECFGDMVGHPDAPILLDSTGFSGAAIARFTNVVTNLICLIGGRTMNRTIHTEKQRIELALKNLRPLFGHDTPDLEILSAVLRDKIPECNPKEVEEFARQVKKFSTADLVQYFQVDKYKVAGSVAALVRAGKIRADKTSKPRDGYGQYVWVQPAQRNKP